jgi:hypothetical protein
MNFVKMEKLWLADHSTLDERWVQQRIADDPSILGLGDLVLRDKERPQPRAGRLDLLLQDSESDRRYEVEIQLGSTDESHIIRTLEYWDVERKRYPQYDHCAVLVAEDITSRFLNVVSLFNGALPIVALQMTTLRHGDNVTLLFTKVLDELVRGLVDEDEEVHESADRAYWESRASKNSLVLTDELLKMVQKIDPQVELKYNKFYIGLARDGQPDNFITMRPKKNFVKFEPRLDPSPEIEKLLAAAGLDLLTYDKRWRRYRIRLGQADIAKHAALLADLMRRAKGAASLT